MQRRRFYPQSELESQQHPAGVSYASPNPRAVPDLTQIRQKNEIDRQTPRAVREGKIPTNADVIQALNPPKPILTVPTPVRWISHSLHNIPLNTWQKIVPYNLQRRGLIVCNNYAPNPPAPGTVFRYQTFVLFGAPQGTFTIQAQPTFPLNPPLFWGASANVASTYLPNSRIDFINGIVPVEDVWVLVYSDGVGDGNEIVALEAIDANTLPPG